MADLSMKSVIEESFTQYAGAVLQSRALVDVRDCLKPSARQIFYCLYTDKFLPNKPFKKTLKAIGSVARMYIHGDASAEGVIMRAGQPFAMRYPLIEVEGNSGNLICTGNWAAPRYTASRLSGFSTRMFEDVDKDTIYEWRDNYDDTEKYPTVLPTKGFYNIVNGCLGIGIGAASSIPQFNIKDVNKALCTLLKNPNCDFEEIYCAPDFATGAFLINEKEVKESLKVGTGASCRLRAKIDYDEKENSLIVTEIPYGVYTNTICKELEAIVENDSYTYIDRFNDLTGTTPLIKIYLTKNANVAATIKFLYKNTSLQYYYGINMTMLENGRFPKVFGWKEALQAHIDHEIEVYTRGYKFDLKKIYARLHIIEGLFICLAKIDEVISTIKNSSSTTEANENLRKNFILDKEQADAVLNMKLSKLAHLEVEKLEKEEKELEDKAADIEHKLNDKEAFDAVLIETWENVSNKYGDDRRTKIVTIEEEVEEEELPTPEEVVVILENSGRIKRVPIKNFKVQKRNGKGVKNKDESILAIISTNTIDTLTLFTNKGKMYSYSVDDIPEDDKGVFIYSLINFDNEEEVIAATSLYHNTKAKYAMFVTKNGLIKKTSLEEYSKIKRGGKGVVATKLAEGDSIANVTFVDEEQMLIVTKNGMTIRFETKLITPIGRVAMGVKSIKLDEGDEVMIGIPIHKESDDIAIFTSNGFGKKTSLSELPIQNRGGKGLSIYKPNDSTGEIVGAATIDINDNIVLIGKPNSICISCSDIPLLGRTSIGNSMIKDSKVMSVVKI